MVEEKSESSCLWMPKGYRLTKSQFLIPNSMMHSVSVILMINFVYYFIYKYEFEFFEQYKIEKNMPWPWKTDPVGWKEEAKAAIK